MCYYELVSLEQTPVATFESPVNHAEQVLSYPYDRPKGSYYADGQMVTLLSDNAHAFKVKPSGVLL